MRYFAELDHEWANSRKIDTYIVEIIGAYDYTRAATKYRNHPITIDKVFNHTLASKDTTYVIETNVTFTYKRGSFHNSLFWDADLIRQVWIEND